MDTTDDERTALQDFWSAGDYAKLAALGGSLHVRMMLALGQFPPGTPWLDMACGTGTIALRAAKLGADVTAQDMAPRMIELTKAAAVAAGLKLKFDVGDCQCLPYPDQAFSVITSTHGAIFAPDHQAVAGELTRLCHPGGRIALTAWKPQGGILELAQLEAGFSDQGPVDQDSPFGWGDRDHATSLLGQAFDLTFTEGDNPVHGSTPDAMTELFWRSSPRIVRLAAQLDPTRADELRTALRAFFERYQRPSGIIMDRPYLIITGQRKA